MAAKYPKRSTHFAHRFVRLMMKAVAAQEVGPDGFCLLSAIAMTEDAKRYRGPVVFFNQPLMAVCGFTSEKVFFRVRQRCIDAGWLVWFPGKKGVAATYWVAIPEQFRDVQDGPVDEVTSELQSDAGSMRESCGEELGTNREVIGNQLGVNRESIGGTFIPNPNPIPIPNPKGETSPAKPAKFNPADAPLPPELNTTEFRVAWVDWCAFRRQSRKPISEKACQKQLAKLAKFGSQTSILAIERAIENDYQGLFPESVEAAQPRGRPPSGRTSVREHNEAVFSEFFRDDDDGENDESGCDRGSEGPAGFLHGPEHQDRAGEPGHVGRGG